MGVLPKMKAEAYSAESPSPSLTMAAAIVTSVSSTLFNTHAVQCFLTILYAIKYGAYTYVKSLFLYSLMKKGLWGAQKYHYEFHQLFPSQQKR